MMKTLIVGTKASFPMDLVTEALSICSGEDQIYVTGTVPVDDLAARYAYDNGIPLRTEVLDTQLHGTNARYYTLNKLLPEMDRVVFFDSDNDSFLESIFDVAESQKKETVYVSMSQYRSRNMED